MGFTGEGASNESGMVENGDFCFFRSLYFLNCNIQCNNYYTVIYSRLRGFQWHWNRWPSMTFTWYECRWPWRYFKVIRLFHIKFLVNGALYGKSYYRVLIGNHTLVFDWCHFWWPWSLFEGHFSLGCHFHVHFSNLWQAFTLCSP